MGTQSQGEMSLSSANSLIVGTHIPDGGHPMIQLIMENGVPTLAIRPDGVRIEGGALTVPTITNSPDDGQYVVTGTSTGKIGGIPALPVDMGGTGMDMAPPKDSILISDGTKYVPATLGAGIKVDYDASGTPVINAGTDFTIVEYEATYSGTHTVATLPIVVGEIMTVQLITVAKGTNGSGGSMDWYHVDSSDVTDIGSTISTGISSSPNVVHMGSSMEFRLYMAAGTIWKGKIKMIAM